MNKKQEKQLPAIPAVSSLPMHTISVFVRNQPGVLVRVALVFARRGFNIESLVVSTDQVDPAFSRMTITCSGDSETLGQMIKQVQKLVDVVRAIDHTGQSTVETEVALVKLRTPLAERTELLQVAGHFKAKVMDCHADSLVFRITGSSEKLDSFVSLLRPFGIVELVRSGKILMTRGPESTT
jgi:acetolactate synthase-1/3 small subunit